MSTCENGTPSSRATSALVCAAENVQRILGAAKRVSDTTLYLLLAAQAQEGMRESLVAQAEKLVKSKRVTHDLFRLGVAALDGSPSGPTAVSTSKARRR